MNIEHIRTFLEIATTGNFNVAADHLNVTQSTVSARIKALEERGHDAVLVTDEGLFGGAQLICCLEDGYCAASDHRKEGMAAGF